MTALAIIETLRGAGLRLSLTDKSGVKVTPASRLTDELRGLIRAHKAELAGWLATANDAEPTDWRTLDRAYLTHHWRCRTCIAAGQGVGVRCDVGKALWVRYAHAARHGVKP